MYIIISTIYTIPVRSVFKELFVCYGYDHPREYPWARELSFCQPGGYRQYPLERLTAGSPENTGLLEKEKHFSKPLFQVRFVNLRGVYLVWQSRGTLHLPPYNPTPRNLYSLRFIHESILVASLRLPSHPRVNATFHVLGPKVISFS